MTQIGPFDLAATYVRLRPDASVETLAVDATFWARLASGKLGAFHNEYLVTCHTFHTDWPTWEMHPQGDEIVCLLSGAATFVLERESGDERIELRESGAYVVVPKGVWHTAKTQDVARMLFITAGEGTQHREAAQ
jgi:mannose-6-phosphate isomerase-like protein (cupin superfamily)